jgi:hypothetical protein
MFSSSCALHQEIHKLIQQARGHVAREYNSTQVLLNWMIGKGIDKKFFYSRCATLGDNVLENIAYQLGLLWSYQDI